MDGEGQSVIALRIVSAAAATAMAASLAGCSLLFPRTPEPSTSEIVGRWEYSSEESRFAAPGSYIEFSADGSYVALLPEMETSAFEPDAEDDEPELYQDRGTWEIQRDLQETGWQIGYEGSYGGNFDVVGPIGDRRLQRDVGWIEFPDRFALRESE